MKNLKFLVAALAFAALFTACNKDGELLKNEYLIDGVNYKIKSAGIGVYEEEGSSSHWLIVAPDIITDSFESEPNRYLDVEIPENLMGKTIDLKTETSNWYVYLNGHSNIGYISLSKGNRDHLISGTLLMTKKGDKYTMTLVMKVMIDEREVEISGHYSGTPEKLLWFNPV